MSLFFIVCEWLYNMDLCMRVIMYIINLFLCCVCFVIIWYVCVTTVFLSLMYIIKIYVVIPQFATPRNFFYYKALCHNTYIEKLTELDHIAVGAFIINRLLVPHEIQC